MDFVDINKNLPGGENMGGLTQNLIYGLWDDVLVWPAAPVSPSNIEASAQWAGDIIMKPGKRAYNFYSTDDASEMKIRRVGSVDGLSFQMELTVFNPGLKKRLLGFIAAAKNENLFLIARDNEGQYYLVGDSQRAAKMIVSEGIGTNKATLNRKGAHLLFVFKTNIVRVYVGDVTDLLVPVIGYTADSTTVTVDDTTITVDML